MPSPRLLLLASSLLLLTLAAPPAAAASTADTSLYRAPRFFLNWLGGGQQCGACPLHHCSIDPAVIHGYCCGCAKFFDRVPTRCPPQMSCPLYSEPLCSDYNYMMDCCC